MSIKFKNAYILDKDFQLLKAYDLVVEGNFIKSIKPTDSFDDKDHQRVIECNHNFLIPGFKNLHAHNAMVFARSLTDDVSLYEWLNEKIFPLEAKLTDEDVYYFTILGIMENLTSGITMCADMYKCYDAMAEAYYHTGYRVNLVDSVMHFDKLINPEEKFHKYNNYKDDNGNLIRYTFALHAEYTNNESTFKLMSDLIHKYKKPYFSHNSETVKEVAECKERWKGLTPTEIQEKYGLYDYGGGGYHCIHFSDHDIEIFKKHNLSIVTNAASNLKLASGIAPIKKFLREGLNVCIGTDGPASNNTIDMFREMYLISTLAKHVDKDPAAIVASEVVKMAIENGARAMGYEDTDSLQEGKRADIVLIDVNYPNMQPKNDFVSNLVYACGKNNVALTMVDGKILYEEGKFFVGEDPNYIYKKCNELIKNLLER